jgi:plastocyanin
MTDRLRSTGGWRLVAALLALAVLLAAAACGDDDDSGGSSDTTAAEDGGGGGDDGAADAELDVTEFQYSDVSAPAGGTLEIVNTSGAMHTFTADDGTFDDEVPDDENVTVDVPAEAGEYPFHCEIHPNMQATLTVE